MKSIEKLHIMAQALLTRELPTQERIREIIEEIRPSFPNVTDEEVDQLAIQFEEIHGVQMADGSILQEPDFEPWLDATRSTIDFYYWSRYRNLLGEQNMSGQVLGRMANVTDRILGLLENPCKPGKWDRRGMVMGYVQSGKTANYIGVATKAADAGYRVIIIIAGLQNRLRNQTQRRVDEGFVGFSRNSTQKNTLSRRSLIGVGRHDSRHQPAAFTTSFKDFNKDTAQSLNLPLHNLNEPAVFVIKKNTHTLYNLIDWLRMQNAKQGTETIREPMLLIDDEADNASINIKHRIQEVSVTNRRIRELLNLFERSCYVGYTATPFANIFIDPDTEDEMVGHDLFPRDFIVSLDPPTNYFGPAKVFHDKTDSVVKNLEDYADLLPMSHKIDHSVERLPGSLCEAIRTFIVARAIRLVRGQHQAHNSMLVNISRFIGVQQQVRDEIQLFVEHIRSSVRVNGARQVEQALLDPEINSLYHVFENHYETSCGESWQDVQFKLHDSVSAISILDVNSRSKSSLDYDEHHTNGLNVIAIGGLALSRGLTLEGLTVSYFLRRSIMYDTLFQMGRWFGYRDGYEDLCRVWMPEEAQGWYEHITESVDELRDELALMQIANATPKEFGLKVRSHPDTLVVTAHNKMGSGRDHRVKIGLANQFVETAILSRNKSSLWNNLRAVDRLVENMKKHKLAPENGEVLNGSRLVRNVPVTVVKTFLRLFENHPGSLISQTDPICRYIDDRAENELSEWDVLFAGVKKRKAISLVDNRLGFELVCQRRTPGKRSNNDMLMVTSKQRVSSRGIARVGLTEEVAREAEQIYDEGRARSGNKLNYPDRIYSSVRTTPLLVVHLLAIGKEGEDLSQTNPVVAWSISFPKTNLSEKKVEYVVNTRWFQDHYGEDDTDED